MIHLSKYVCGFDDLPPKIIIVLYILVSASIFSCNRGESNTSSNLVRHPIEENIPYYNHNHLPIDTTQTFSELQEKPNTLRLLHRYLKNPDEIVMKKLDVKVGSPFPAFNIVSPSKRRLVILDDNQSQLLEYDLNLHRVVNIAEFGRGPGDIHLPMEMVMHDGFIYIVREDMYISRFNCQSAPCQFDQAVSIGITPTSLAVADHDFTILGAKSRNASSGPILEEEGINNKPVYIFDQNGQELTAFGSMYDIEGHWMLLRPFVYNGMIRYSSMEHLYILTFQRFPYIYIYDAATLELKETYEISNFILGKQNYWPNEGRLRVPLEDFSMITKTSVIEGSLLWIETQTNTNYREGDNRAYWDRRYDYYVVDLKNKEMFYMGSYNYKEEGKNIYLTDEGLIIYDERDGNLFWGTE